VIAARFTRQARACAALCSLLLGACSQAPLLKLPDVPVASAYKEAAPWTPAQPADDLPRDAWWTAYGDTELNALQQRLVTGSPDLAAALARYQQAQAATSQLQAGQWPNVNASLAEQRNRQSEMRPLRVLGPLSPNDYASNTVGLSMDYELDLWGRVRNLVEAGRAQDQAAQADLASARLALQAQLADNFIALRGLDRDTALLRESESAYARALELVTHRHDGGIASGLDLARAQAQLEAVRSQARQSAAQRALIEHGIAALLGESPSSFAIAPSLTEIALPAIPTGLPSTLLQRRPDIAAAERRVAAANASVGVARAAYYPAITLSALVGFQSSQFGDFIRAPNTFWTIGPTLLMNVFDAGRRQAETARVQAVLDENGARYRGVVLGAFQQVEDNLVLLRQYGAAAESEAAAVTAAQRALGFATTRYREGAANYLEVVTAQTTALQAQRSALDLSTRQRRASVQLVKALGGGWAAPSL
jgi:NodT family efflux transporter outer membrane factor (OMF) lipoprotein